VVDDTVLTVVTGGEPRMIKYAGIQHV